MSINYILEAEDKTDLFIFKSFDDANIYAQELKENDYKYKSVIVAENESEVISLINSLEKKLYNTIYVIINENNFTSGNFINIGLNISNEFFRSRFAGAISYLAQSLYSMDGTFFCSLSSLDPSKETLGSKGYAIGELWSKENGRIVEHKNCYIKFTQAKKGKERRIYYQIMSNYIFKIKEILLTSNEEILEQNIKFEITGMDGTQQIINVLAKDKHSISSFKKYLTPTGPFLDCLSNNDFTQILKRLYEKGDYKTVYQYNHPGLVEDKNVWLLADEVINLED